MTRAPDVHHLVTGLAAILVAVTLAPGVQAQSRSEPDFLFARPHASVGIRGGWLSQRADSDLFAFLRDELTIERRDFDAPTIAVDVGAAVGPRTDAVFGVEFAGRSVRSEYRDLVDNDRLPITQTSRLRQTNLTASLRLALAPRGRQVGRLAWVPGAVVPYVGAGGGAVWYEFRQTGDFVDFLDLSVFTGEFRSTGWAPSAHLLAGVDIRLTRRLYLTGEGRYVWANAELGPDFSSFEPIDLTGFRMTTGVAYHF